MNRLLVVDDNATDRELVRRCLADVDDLELSFAEDGAEALEAIERDPPDLVLTDLRMPRVDGLELVERVGQQWPDVPLILMTAEGSEQVAIRALRAGASSYVPKRKLREELADTVEQVLELAARLKVRSELSRYLRQMSCRLELPTDLGLITDVVTFLQAGQESIGFATEPIRSRVGLALMEALANAMVRGNLEVGSDLRRKDRAAYDRLVQERLEAEPYRSRTVTLKASETAERVEYQISDEGDGFDPTSVPDPTDAENLLAVSGRGIMLMRTFMDSVEFGADGRSVTLVKLAPAEDPDGGGD